MIYITLNLVIASIFSAPFFDPNREDRTLPNNCQFLEEEDFSLKQDIIVYGIEESTEEGFDYEVAIERHEARLLWDVLSPFRHGDMDAIRRSPEMSHYYDLLVTKGEEMDFNYHNEGDILEALALIDLEKKYPSKDYFRTGGIAYGDDRDGRTIGELDVLVGRKSDCKILVIGEAKLGMNKLGYARQQLQRFINFMDSQ